MAMKFPSTLINVLAGVATSAIISAAQNPSNALSASEAPAVSDEVRREIASDPRIQAISKAVDEAATPVTWYSDKVFLASIVGVISAVVGTLWGVQLTPDHQAVIVNILPGVLGGIAAGVVFITRLFSRVKPLTTTPVAK